jgi:hypothetical protein
MNNIKSFNNFLVNESLLGKSYFKKDYHQNIMDYAYNWWNKNNTGKTSYSDMIDFIKKDLGEEAVLLILLGSYNYQVGNGGHSQYNFNGYSQHLSELINLLDKYFDSPNKRDLLSIMTKADTIFDDYNTYSPESCYNCNGSGEIETGDSYNGEVEYETCYDCGGDGETDESEYLLNGLDDLDKRYYEIDDSVMEWANKFAKEVTDRILGR